MDAVILAGGLGTRLKEVGLKVPKPLAPINGKPFLEILLRRLEGKISRVILAIGYKGEMIREHCGKQRYKFPILFSEEKELLGTGGALKQALELSESEDISEDILALNGDTFLNVDFHGFQKFHKEKGGCASIVCLPAMNENRYGAIRMDEKGQIIDFFEKGVGNWINGGIYLLKKNLLKEFTERNFSLEKDAFPRLLPRGIFGYTCSPFFIDIGTKESYFEAQKCLKNMC